LDKGKKKLYTLELLLTFFYKKSKVVGFCSKISLKSAHFGTKAHIFQKIWRFGKEFVNLRINKIAADGWQF